MKKCKTIFRFFYVCALIAIIALCMFAPGKITDLAGYEIYTVLSESMEPKIPMYSAVLVKKVKEEGKLSFKPQQIITFRANRFGEEIVLTHRFNKTEYNENGQLLYRTNAEGKENLDAYETTREDIIGIYMFHIPYLGKVILFLQSPFAYIWAGEVIIILLIRKTIEAKWEEKERSK